MHQEVETTNNAVNEEKPVDSVPTTNPEPNDIQKVSSPPLDATPKADTLTKSNEGQQWNHKKVRDGTTQWIDIIVDIQSVMDHKRLKLYKPKVCTLADFVHFIHEFGLFLLRENDALFAFVDCPFRNFW